MIHSIPGTYDVRENGSLINALIQWQYDFKSNNTICRLDTECKHITLSGRGIAGLMMSYKIQEHELDSINITDADYSCDRSLKEFSDFDSLKTYFEELGYGFE